MRDENVGCLVITQEGRPSGVVTDRDLAVRLVAQGRAATTRIGELVTHEPVTASVNETIENAAELALHWILRPVS